MDRLKAELMYERRTSEEHLSRFEDERRVWQEEKEKVKKKKSGRIKSLISLKSLLFSFRFIYFMKDRTT